MGYLVRKIAISAAKKAVKIDPSDFITQDNMTSLFHLAGHVVKLLF